MANEVRIYDGGHGTVHLRVRFPMRREAMISLQTVAKGVRLGIWGRDLGDRSWHAWPGPHLDEDFFSPMEAAIMRYGVEETAACALDQMIDEDFSRRIMGALTIVLDAAANGMNEQESPAAA